MNNSSDKINDNCKGHHSKDAVITACSRCLYDEHTPSISFDDEGICNYCRQHESLENEYPAGSEGERIFSRLAEEIKYSGKRKKYDCVVGVSGGCDSSYLIYRMKELGLRPLAVHFDNTWNSATAVSNIRNVLNALDVDLYTYVVDNKEYDDIYRSFLRAGVPDIDSPTDIGLAVTLYKAAEKYGIKYCIEGHNFRTEGISPLGWLYMDGKYIEDVQKKFGTCKLTTFPNMKMLSFMKWMIVKKIKRIRPFWYLTYNKEDVKVFLTEKFGWKWYGGHHLENRFTAFCHSYFFPVRFGIDQRKNGYSALIRSGQLTREEGVRLMSILPYITPEIKEVVELIKKRLGFSDDEFQALMELPKKTYKDYKTYKGTFEALRPFFWLMYKFDLVPKSFYLKYTLRDN
ncbi:N-acetyl sugar amidotransferase [Elusimicrobiota bacterium]